MHHPGPRARYRRKPAVIAFFVMLAVALPLSGRVVAFVYASSSEAHSSAAAEKESSGKGSAISLLGRKIFFDPSLSASGRISCATCHSPSHAYGPPNGLAVQLGGPAVDRQGARAVPSLRYVLNRTPAWNRLKRYFVEWQKRAFIRREVRILSECQSWEDIIPPTPAAHSRSQARD